jgi:MbtH protein
MVLVNGEGQHSLWPASTSVPAGWTVIHGPALRQACLDHITTYWTDLRPSGLSGSPGGITGPEPGRPDFGAATPRTTIADQQTGRGR